MTAAEYFTQQGEAKGIAKGKAEGKAEGLTLGEQNKSRTITVNALQKGLEISLIADLTGLEPKVIEQIKTELEK